MSNCILKVEDSGRLITLDDSSQWGVSLYDAFTTRMWMALDNVSVSRGKMKNLERNETVSVTKES